MASVNKVILVGNCGRDPEVRYLPSGKAVAQVSIATSSRRKDKQTGETVEDTQWHRVTFFERLAEVVGEYVKKGSPIYVEGRIKYGTYDKDGVTQHTTDILATEMQLLGSKGEQQGGQRPAQHQQPQGQNGYAAARGRPQQPAAPAQNGAPSGFDDMDDDIPF